LEVKNRRPLLRAGPKRHGDQQKERGQEKVTGGSSKLRNETLRRNQQIPLAGSRNQKIVPSCPQSASQRRSRSYGAVDIEEKPK
jgi:hypothetical protein